MSIFLDIPRYRIESRAERFIFSRTFMIILFGIVLYVGFYVNYYLLQESIPEYINWVFAVGMIFILAINVLTCYTIAGQNTYIFYDKKLEIRSNDKRFINYSSIKNVVYEENIIDQWFKTGTLVIYLDETADTRKLKIQNVVRGNEVYFFIKKTIGMH